MPHSPQALRRNSMEPGLYLLGSPIGNLEDVSARTVRMAQSLDLVFAEDTRRTRRLWERYNLETPLRSCHRFNEAARSDQLQEWLRQGKAVGYITEAGTPGVSDPGRRLVTRCREAGYPVTICPGPSAVTAAVAVSGLVEARFSFMGFPPPKKGQRQRLWEEVRRRYEPAVFFESPYRVIRLLEEWDQIFPDWSVFLGREMTKKFEEHLIGQPGELAHQFQNRNPKGEFVLVLAPPSPKKEGTI